MQLLDSDVLIEMQRARPGAANWLQTLKGSVSLPAPVAWELLIGSRDKVELRRAQDFLAGFDVEPLRAEDSELAERLIGVHCLSSGLGLPDYLIAAQAINRKAKLYKFNLKHFQAIAGLDVRLPYER